MKRKFAFKRKPDGRDWINLTAILLITAAFIWIGIRYTNTFGSVDTSDLLGSAEHFQAFVLGYGDAGLLMLTFFHTFQVVISFIPSVLVQFVGGMIYGMLPGMLTGIIGIAIGTAISFYLSRLLGRRAVTLFISEKNIDRMERLIAGDLSTLVLLALFILPTPKDFIAYFVGLTAMKASRFFSISAVGRLPGMLVATYLGAHIFERNYVMIAAIAVSSSLLCLMLVLFKDKIVQWVAQIGTKTGTKTGTKAETKHR